MVGSANCDYYDGTGIYKQLGYVPYDVKSTGSSMTLEYAYDDWVIYRTARCMGLSEVAETYRKRAENYRNVFDPSTGFARARMSDGSWKPDFNRYDTHGQGFIEGNSWNYSMYVPHDPAGLIALMGGDGQFTARLDSLFTEYLPDRYFAQTEDVTREGLLGMYVHGNEPRATMCPTSTCGLRSRGKRSTGCVRSWIACTVRRSTACAATTIAARCRRGTFSRRWILSRLPGHRPVCAGRALPALYESEGRGGALPGN